MSRNPLERRVLFLAPTSRDAELTRSVLEEAGFECHVCPDPAALGAELERGAALVLITEEAVATAVELRRFVARQPPWSDLPVLLLVHTGSQGTLSKETLERLGNVTLVDRPVRMATLVSATRVALRARQKQYLIRGHLLEREQADRRRETELAVARLLAAGGDREVTVTGILGAVGEGLGWDAGDVWVLDRESRRLRCSVFWSRTAFPEFAAATRGLTLAPGEGLPGRVWSTALAEWMPDLSREGFVRASSAAADGLQSGFGFPITVGGISIGVMEFFSLERREPDDALLATIAGIATHLGQYLERRQAEDALAESDRRKTEFLATLAHELRNPLAPIRTAAHLLSLDEPENAKLRWGREMIERQLQHLTRLVDDLLDISRITRGKVDLRRERIDLASVVRSALETSSPWIEAAHLDLTVSMPPEPIAIDGDPVRLAQVFSNLLNNAAKFTPSPGSITLTVTWHEDEVVIRVRDTGVGIAPDLVDHVFEMFVQGDHSLERTHGGLGIGLTLVRSFVEMHGGSVSVASEGEGRGSEFTVRLPVVTQALPRAEDRPSAKAGNGTLPSRHRVLVVDDNADGAESLSRLLEVMGNEVRTAHDGFEAIEAADTFEPDVVLLDIGMPRLNGYEAARRIRDRVGAGVTLVALTGWGQEEDRRRSREAGFDHHWVKPVDLAKLEQLLG